MKRTEMKVILPFFWLTLLTIFFCWFFVGRYGIFGARVDWISQHSVIPDYFRQQFYETGELFPEFAANIGGGQNIYNFSYYGLFSPVILVSYLFPSVKMGDYLMAVSVISLTAAVLLFYGWLLKRGFSGKISFMVSLMYLLSGPMIFHSYCQLMFVNYMPFLCMAFLGVDRYFDQGKKLLYTVSVFLMIMTSFYFSIGGMLALVLYGIYRYLECGRKNSDSYRGRIKDRTINGRTADDMSERWLYAGIEDKVSDVKKLDEFRKKIIACDINGRKSDFGFLKINIACDLVFGFLRDGIRFLCPMMVSVLMGGILLVPTAAALMGRNGVKGELSLVSLLIPDIQMSRMLYTPYTIGLTSVLVTVLIAGFTYRAVHERVLSWGCTVVLAVPLFTWTLNGGLYIREKALIPFLPLLCYLIACYVKKIENERVSFIAGMVPFLITIGILCVGQQLSGSSKYGILYLIDAVVMAVCYLLFYFREATSQVDMLACTFGGCREVFGRKKQSMILLAPPVVFLVLFGSVFHEQAGRIESREFYERVTNQAIGQVIQETLAENGGFYRLEQVGTDEENAADLNRVWNMGQYISSIYSSSYNKDYQNFRKEVFGVEEPFRNDMMQSVSRNPVFLKLMGVRYLISEDEIPGYEAVKNETEGDAATENAAAGSEAVRNKVTGDEPGAGGLSVYENRDVAPIAYATDQVVSERMYADLEFPYNQMVLAYGAVREGEDGEKERGGKSETVDVSKTETRDDEAVETQILEEVQKALVPVEMELPEQESGTLRITREGNGYRVRADKKGKIQLALPETETVEAVDGERILFLQFDVKNRKSGQDVSVWLEGEKNKLSAGNHIYYNGNTTFSFAAALEKGNNSVELTLGKGDYEMTDLECFLGGWGKQAQLERSSRLYQAEFHPDQEKTKGNVISGSVDVEREGYFVTSIPYDRNFEIQVDGKAVEYEKVNTAFLGFPIREGRHNVEIVYHAPGRKAGAWCSLVGAVILIVSGCQKKKLKV